MTTTAANPWLKPDEVADVLRCSRHTVYRLIYAKHLRAAKLPGGALRIPQSELDRLLGPDPKEED